MITYLDGKLAEKAPTRIVVDVQGVGYEVFIPLSSFDKLPSTNDGVRILTYEHVREDIHALYGFMTQEERDLFMRLLGISGIGPKLALSALSGLTVHSFKAAVVAGDVRSLSSISGVGKKTAERIVVELRDRITEGEALEAGAGAPGDAEGDTRIRDAVAALISLGYKQAAAWKMVRAAMKNLGGEADVEDVVREALVQ